MQRALAAANASAKAWEAKARDKEELLKKYQAALKKARGERDAARKELAAARDNADAHHKEQLAAKDAEIEEIRRAAAQAREQHEAALEAVRARAAAAAGAESGEIEKLKRQAMEALQHVQSQGSAQLEAQRQHYEGELKRMQAQLLAAQEAAASAAASPRLAPDRKSARRTASMEKRLRALAALAEPRQGFLVKYGARNKTWNKRRFALVRGVLIYYREDNSVGGEFPLDEADIADPAQLGMLTGTSKMTVGVNKPTAYEFVVAARGKDLRLCAQDERDEEGWKQAIMSHIKALSVLEQLHQEHSL